MERLTENEIGIPPEFKEGAVRLVLEHQGEFGSQWEAIGAIAVKSGCGVKSLRRWVP